MSSTVKISGVVSSARKVIARVPQTDRVLTLPDGMVWSDYRKEGQANPAILLLNATDVNGGKTPNGTVQGGRVGDYTMVNEVSEEAAQAFLSDLGGDDYTVETLEKALATLASKGFRDQYTTDVGFVTSKLSPAGLCINAQTKPDGKFESVTAAVCKRDDRDVIEVFVSGADGYIHVVHKGEPKRIERDIFVRTYRAPNGDVVDPQTIVVK
jgi:hypothetical protein